MSATGALLLNATDAIATHYSNASALSNGTAPTGTDSVLIFSLLKSLLALLIVLGNGLIIVSVAIVKKLRQPGNYLIVSLAWSDFLVGLVVLPVTIYYDHMDRWTLPAVVCDMHVSFDVICCTASIMNLCMISIDRLVCFLSFLNT